MNHPNPLEIDCRTVQRKLESGEPLLFLDCREQKEFDLVRIAGTSLIPMSEIAARVDELQPHRDREIVVHCHHGGRSLRVTQWLREQGFPTVKSMAGGIDAWALEIEPGMLRY